MPYDGGILLSTAKNTLDKNMIERTDCNTSQRRRRLFLPIHDINGNYPCGQTPKQTIWIYNEPFDHDVVKVVL